ncbi:MAG: hypothetical protein ACO1RT_19885 [Planctomycetaceae bacterium]
MRLDCYSVFGMLIYRHSTSRKWRFAAWVLLALAGLGFYAASCHAQPPGTLPPSTILNAPAAAKTETTSEGSPKPSTESSALQPKAFLMLDSAGNPVMVPGMTFEKLDRLMRLESGLERPAKPYSIDSLSIEGRADENHAELQVTTRITVEATGEAWVAVPLRMGNFHRTGADVSGVENYRLDLSEDGTGYVLHLQSDTRRSVVVAMRVVVRVSPPPTAAIEFRLPDTVCDISLKVPEADVSASIFGRGDEVLRTQKAGPATEVKIDSGGGTFSLRFGSQAPVIDNRPVLEAESRIIVDWQQADNSPLAKVDLSVRNLRGDVPRVSLAIPESLQLLQQPEVLNGSPFEVLDAVDVENGTGRPRQGEALRRLDVVPLAGRGDSRVEISLDGQMRSEGGRAGGKVIVAPVGMDNAVQTGEIEVRTPRDYRLRWTSHQWVHSVWDKADSDSLTSRVYKFRFDRVPFELPIWLSARARQLRVESEQRMTLYDSLASLRMTIRTTGSIPDSRILPIEVGPWTVKSVFIADTTTVVEADRNGDTIEIDLASLPSGGSEGDRIEVVLVRSLIPGESKIELPLPRVAGNDEFIAALPSTLTVVSQNDSRFVIDLPESLGIGEVIRRGSAPVGTPTTVEDLHEENRYSLPDVAQASRLVGYLVRERPSVSVLADAEVSIIADRITEVVDWTIYPQGALRGRLPVAWGETPPSTSSGAAGDVTAEASASDPQTSTTNSQSAVSTETPSEAEPRPTTGPGATADPGAAPAAVTTAEGETALLRLYPLAAWSVAVDDAPATIRVDADGRYQIYSDRLGSGPHRIRFRRTRALPLIPVSAASIAGVHLPRPTLPDVTLRGPVVVRLRGSNQWELSAVGSDGRLVDELTLTSLVEKELPLHLKPIEKREDDFVVRRGVLRTAIGDSTHYEQFLATVEGGGVLRIGLSGEFGEVLARAKVDGTKAEVLRDANDRCVIRIGESGPHEIDFQIWVPRRATAGTVTDTIEPVLMLPIGIERLYWQLIVPRDEHLVWATATMGRAMRWELDRWRLNRISLHNDADLVEWSGVTTDALMPSGNRYLLVGIDSGSLAAKTMSRLSMWLIVAGLVLVVASLLIYVPTFRHPLTAVFGAVVVGGLLLLLPDAAVMAGQFMLVAMLIVAVMSGVRQLLLTRRGDRVLAPSRDSSDHPTTRHPGTSHHDRVDPYPDETEPHAASGSAVESRV